MHRALILATQLLLAASSAHAITPYPPIAGIQFDASIPQEQYDLMSRDLGELQKHELTVSDTGFTELLGIQVASSKSLLKWLADRVHYVVSEDFDPASQTVSIRKFSGFPYPDAFPDSSFIKYNEMEPKESRASDSELATVMANIGGSLYAGSKKAHYIRTVSIPGIENVSITSPRVGILKIGKGLFNKKVAGLGGEPTQSKAHLAHRLGVLFHEARHSDGHGKSLAFSHATCPPEHHFAGLPACDKNLNGPYTIQAHFLNSYARSCRDCTQRELQLVRMMAIDSISRVIPAVSTANRSDLDGKFAYQLRVLTRTIYLCQTSHEMGWTAANPIVSCDDLDSLKNRISQIRSAHPGIAFTESENWDPMPERVGSPLK